MRLRDAVKIQARQHWDDIEGRTRANPYRQAWQRFSDRRTLAALILAYGQLLVAVDTNRLTAWAWPVLADNVTDRDWWPLALAGSYFNPWRVAR